MKQKIYSLLFLVVIVSCLVQASRACCFPTVKENAEPSAEAALSGPVINITTVTDASCHGGNNGAISISVSGGTFPYYYLWVTGATTQNISNLIAGAYSVTVTDATSATATTNITVTQPTALTASSTIITPIVCSGGTATISLSGSGGISPYNGVGTFIRSAGTYSFTVTDNHSCTAPTSITITQPPAIVINASKTNPSCCSCTDGTISTTVSGGSPPYNYLWSNGTTGYSLNGLFAGTYNFTVTDANGCTPSTSVTITSPIIHDSIATSPAPCGGGQGSATVYPYGGINPYHFRWSTSDTVQTISAAIGIYNITVTDSAGCSTKDNCKIITNSAPAITVSPNVSLCSGDSTTISASGGVSYTWSPPTGLSSTNGATVTANPAATTTYQVIVTDAGGCANVSSINITVNPSPVGTISQDVSICAGTSTNLHASGGTIYLWTPSSGLNSTTTSNPTATPVATTTYTVSIGNSFGCVTSATTTITVKPLPTVSVNPDVTICFGDSAQLIASSSAGFSWSPTSSLSCSSCSHPLASPTVTTNYTVTVTDTNFCSTKAYIKVTVPGPSCNYNIMKGICFVDYNSNGVQDAGEPAYIAAMVASTWNSKTYSSQPDTQGTFLNYLDTGATVTTLQNVLPYYTVSPTQHITNYSTYHNTDTVNFALVPLSGYQDIRISLVNTHRGRPGTWSGFSIVYSNVGVTPVSGSVYMVKDHRLNIGTAYPSYSSIHGDTITWLYSNLLPNTSRTITIQLPIPTSGVNVGDTLNDIVVIEPIASDNFPADNYSATDHTVVNSSDPNDKEMMQGGYFSTMQVANGDYLNYIIRFQNTGTDTAFKIIIRDTLDNKLDGSTFDMISASNNYVVGIENQKNITWTFNNILLPDSNHNEQASHGYVAYRVKPKSTVAGGDVIKNTADIIFDYNQPIATNTAVTTVTFPTAIANIGHIASNIQLFPNPSEGVITLSYSLPKSSDVTIGIYNSYGQLVKEITNERQTAGRQETVFDAQKLALGIYFLKMSVEGNVAVMKMVKM